METNINICIYLKKRIKIVNVFRIMTYVYINEKHALHIHTFGDLQSTDCLKCGGHWNPNNKDHGGRHDENSHAGDLGNITVKDDGKATFSFKTKKFTLFGDVTKSVIGRSIVIHEHIDDNGKGGFPDSLVTGHAGGRLDCAVIGHCK